MAYYFKLNDASVEAGVKRIAPEQVRKAIAEIDDGRLSPDDTIHQVRKRCKNLRALLRLVRGAFEGYEAENAFFRDAATGLSSARDATVLIATFDDLVLTGGDGGETIRAELLRHQQQTASDDVLHARLSAFRNEMVAASERVPAWNLGKDGFAAIAGGLEKTYKDARRAMRMAHEKSAAANFHEWRKRAKDHWNHTRLLHPIRPKKLQPHRKKALELSELLGDHHDIAVLEAWLLADPERFAGVETLVPLVRRIETRRTVLESEAFALGNEVFAHKPDELRDQWGAYWKKWRNKQHR